jgi:hypothetical protein
MTLTGADVIQFNLGARRHSSESNHNTSTSKSHLAQLFLAKCLGKELAASAPLLPPRGLFQNIFDHGQPIQKRENLAAVAATVFCHREHNQFLLQKLASPLEEDRAVAAMTMGFAGNRVALPALQRLLKHDACERVQKAAIFGICGLRDGRLDSLLADVLVDALKRPLGPAVLKTLLGRLKLFCDMRFESVFVNHARHDDLSIRIAALQGLFFSCGEEGLSCARQMLRAGESVLRRLSIQILERHGCFLDVEKLLPLLGDEEFQVSQAARQAIATLKRAH